MSRDAKVGLVIVFAFVFLLGTILVHRLHLTDLGQLAGGNGTAAGGSDTSPVGDSTPGESSLNSSDPSAVTTVDAHPEESVNAPLGGSGMTAPLDSSFSGSQRLAGQPNSMRPPVDVPETADSGAHISLTDPRDDPDSTEVVESNDTSGSSRGNDLTARQPSETESPRTRPDSQHRSPPLLEISAGTSGTESTARDTSGAETGVRSTEGDVSSLDSNEPAADLSAEAPDTTISETESMADTQPDRRIPPLNRPPSLAPDDEPTEMDTGSMSIQQAADKRRSPPEDSSPPQPPQSGEPPQAIIESVPDRDTQATPRAADRSADPADPFSPPSGTPPRSSQSDDHQVAGDKTYVVKEGDNFWSISARQYGTGKYYRALEEYNKDRLSRSANGGKVLRSGTEIALPDESLLRSNSARKKSAEPAGTRPSKYDPWKQDSSTDNPKSQDAASTPKRQAESPPGTYRVKEGDTLSTIALRELGTSKRWQEIFRMNRDSLDDPQSIKAGMVLKIPSTVTAEKAAGRPNF